MRRALLCDALLFCAWCDESALGGTAARTKSGTGNRRRTLSMGSAGRPASKDVLEGLTQDTPLAKGCVIGELMQNQVLPAPPLPHFAAA